MKSRVSNIIDLPAADAWYHSQCDKNFSNNQLKPNFAIDSISQPSKRGRKLVTDERKTAFDIAMQAVFDSEEGQVKVLDFLNIMTQNLPADIEPYSERHVRRLLLELLADDVRIDEGVITLNG